MTRNKLETKFQFLVFFLTISSLLSSQHSTILSKLTKSASVANLVVETIFNDWEVSKFPNFLRSGYLPEPSWDQLKLKFQHKILRGLLNKDTDFTISFTGSSVTAAHDHYFTEAFPSFVNDSMHTALSAVGINLVVRNAAMGNNPCMPYNPCVRTFAGEGVDILHWEQEYNCGLPNTLHNLEQFIRQSSFMDSQPVIVFSGSETTNW